MTDKTTKTSTPKEPAMVKNATDGRKPNAIGQQLRLLSTALVSSQKRRQDLDNAEERRRERDRQYNSQGAPQSDTYMVRTANGDDRYYQAQHSVHAMWNQRPPNQNNPQRNNSMTFSARGGNRQNSMRSATTCTQARRGRRKRRDTGCSSEEHSLSPIGTEIQHRSNVVIQVRDCREAQQQRQLD